MRHIAFPTIVALVAGFACSNSPVRTVTRDTGTNDASGAGPEVATSDGKDPDLPQADTPLGTDAGKERGPGGAGGAAGAPGGTGGVSGATGGSPSSDGATDAAALGGNGGNRDLGATGGTSRDSGLPLPDGGSSDLSGQCRGGFPCLIPEGCGDGVNNQGGIEECDDGNVLAGDGCNGVCNVEPSWTCPKEGPCVSTIVCGDGVRSIGEACDDGNTKDGDGCNFGCKMQDRGTICIPGQLCVRTAICGNGRLDFAEGCDDGNTKSADGCDTLCVRELGFICPKPGSPCIPDPRCGNGIVEASRGEVCDDRNRKDRDGCSADCKTKVAACTCTPGQLCTCPAGTCGIGTSTCPSTCGNGIVEGSEDCDDGSSNATTPDPGQAYNGCTADCKRGAFCGDGAQNGSEQCDNGWNDGRLGTCNPDCTKVAAWCGDGILEADYGEECDPAVPNGPACTYGCRFAGGCGDMQVQPPEECDLGDYGMGEYGTCTPSCRRAAYCGDGAKNGPEQCDDGILDGSYGTCTPWCKLAPHCGDGLTSGPEECDDGMTYNGRNGYCTASCKSIVYY
jgi:cysteine-rich repeat protein